MVSACAQHGFSYVSACPQHGGSMKWGEKLDHDGEKWWVSAATSPLTGGMIKTSSAGDIAVK
jgi:hypothetical protein